MDSSQTGEGRQVLGAGEVHGNNPPQQPSSEEKLDDLRMRGEGNLLSNSMRRPSCMVHASLLVRLAR